MMREFLPARERQDRIVTALRTVSKATGRSLAQVALAWLRQREIPVIPIIGARKLSQLQDNLASLTLTLTADQVKTLDEASHIELGFPHDFYRRDLVRTVIYGGMRDSINA
jgi:aryl-alcohol dehydrogenase-like predicted oxidoreductase